jgi:hypothetical protein
MSTPVNKNYLDMNNHCSSEIRWIKDRILSLREKFQRRPSTIREIRDLERQIVERGGVPDQHEWLADREKGVAKCCTQ